MAHWNPQNIQKMAAEFVEEAVQDENFLIICSQYVFVYVCVSIMCVYVCIYMYIYVVVCYGTLEPSEHTEDGC